MNNSGVMYLGNYCPFFSYGGTGTIVMYILLGDSAQYLPIPEYCTGTKNRRSLIRDPAAG